MDEQQGSQAPNVHEPRVVYFPDGSIEVDGKMFSAQTVMELPPDQFAALRTILNAHERKHRGEQDFDPVPDPPSPTMGLLAEAAKHGGIADEELPGMWERADYEGGETDSDLPRMVGDDGRDHSPIIPLGEGGIAGQGLFMGAVSLPGMGVPEVVDYLPPMPKPDDRSLVTRGRASGVQTGPTPMPSFDVPSVSKRDRMNDVVFGVKVQVFGGDAEVEKAREFLERKLIAILHGWDHRTVTVTLVSMVPGP